jgi:hypothetical protein
VCAGQIVSYSTEIAIIGYRYYVTRAVGRELVGSRWRSTLEMVTHTCSYRSSQIDTSRNFIHLFVCHLMKIITLDFNFLLKSDFECLFVYL